MSSTPPADGYGQPDPSQPNYGQPNYGQPNYGQQPGADPTNPYGGAPQPMRPAEMPGSVATAVKLLWASIGLSVVSGLLTFTMLDSIVDKAIKDVGGSATIDPDTVRTGAIVGGVFGLIISCGIVFLLLTFIKKGANWARIVYTVIGGIGLVFGVIGLSSQPPILLVLSLVGLVLTAAILFFLWKKESAPWFAKPAYR